MNNLKQHHDLICRYRDLLEEVDGWFRGAMARFPEQIACTTGCSHCCRGLFDITLLDGLLVQAGFAQLPADLRERVLERASGSVATVRRTWPDFDAPWLLNSYPEDEYDAAMPDEDETPCVLLDDDGRCLIYDHRPMTCRLHGIPHRDSSGEVLFDEWCSLNFTTLDPLRQPDLQFHFSEIFTQEQLLFRELARRLTGQPLNELDTLIPTALLIDFAHFTLPEQLWTSLPNGPS